jgi:hypothetical protein
MKAILALVFGMALVPGAFAAEFQPFPGATLNEQLTEEAAAELARARPAAQLLYGKPTIYTTPAPFDAVLTFYKKLGAREFIVPTPFTTGPHEETIPSKMIVGAPDGGMKFNKAILVFDDAPEPFKSNCWVEISHPVAGKLVGKKIGDIEQLTGITYVNKQPLP